MKPTEIQPIDRAGGPSRSYPDRLTQLLIWAAFFLVAALVAMAVDLWLWPASDGPVAEAVGQTSIPDSPMPASDGPVAEAVGQTPVPDSPTPALQATAALPEEPTAATVPSTVKIAAAAPVTPPPCVPPDDWGIHVVQMGNSLESLARRYGTDVDTLMHVNCLNTHTIFIDQHLYVPGPVTTPTPLPPIATHRPQPSSTPRPGASATPLPGEPSVAEAVPTARAEAGLAISIPERYLNIVLLGSDKRPTSGAWRTDSMIVVSVDSANNVVRLLSIPRDLWVYIPGHGYNRVNTADLWGELAKKGTGPERVKQTIYHNLGIPIHHYVRVDFQGFIKIIDTVGGVDIDVECALSDINLSAGMHHMNGKQALRYARSRKSTNDFDRTRRQRKVLLALWDQALSLDIIPKLPELWKTMADSFQTDLSLEQVINLAYVGAQLKPQHILSRAIGPSQVQSWVTPQGAAVLLPRNDKIQTMLQQFYAPVDAAQLDSVNKVRVRVLNGWQRQDADQLAAANLRWEGFAVTGTGLADRQDYAQSQIAVYSGNLAAAQQLASQLNLPASAIQEVPDASQPVDIQVILGRDYDPCQR